MAANWRDSFAAGADWYNQRPLRERLLILVTAMVLVLFMGWEWLVVPVTQQNRQLEERMAALNADQSALLNRQQALNERLASDPSQALRKQLEARQQRLAQLNQQVSETTGQLVAPQAMVSLLRDILATQEALALQALELKAPTPVYAPASESGEPPEPGNEALEPLLYAHDVELHVQGSYLNVLAYLKRLESLDARLGWQVLDYRAGDWPSGEALIRVRTLSLEKAWLGV